MAEVITAPEGEGFSAVGSTPVTKLDSESVVKTEAICKVLDGEGGIVADVIGELYEAGLVLVLKWFKVSSCDG